MLEVKLAQSVLGNELRFLGSRVFRGGHIWEVEKVRGEFEVCRRCASPSKTLCGRVWVKVREEGFRNENLWLRVLKHRYFCKTCRKPFTEPTPGVWPGRRTTQRFRKALARDCENMTDLSRVRKIHCVSSGLLYKVFYEQCEVKLRERQNQVWPEVIGIDEHFFRRENRRTEFVTMITNLKKRRLFEVVHGKDTKTVMAQLEDIPGRENVKIAVIDMSDTYRALVTKFFPNAQIVADKFHVLRLLSPALIKTRRQIHGHRKELKWRRLILRNEMNLDYDQRFELRKYLENHPILQELHRMKERLHEFYRCKGTMRASQSFERLVKLMEISVLPEIQKLRKTLLKWKHQLILYFDQPYTNALTEALNGRGKLLQRRACGYKSFRNYRVRLLTACGF